MLRILLIIPVFLYTTSVTLAEFDYQSYQPISVAELHKRHRDDLLQTSLRSEYVLSATTFKYVIPVNFIRELRKLSAGNKELIKAWQTTLRVPEDFVRRYQHEFKAVFENKTYWIPVQEELLLPMSSELHPGDRFELFVIVIGAKDNKLVILATEFKSDRAPL